MRRFCDLSGMTMKPGLASQRVSLRFPVCHDGGRAGMHRVTHGSVLGSVPGHLDITSENFVIALCYQGQQTNITNDVAKRPAAEAQQSLNQD